jgi:RNA polymerase sigma factor (TIGR02999 family)
VSERVLCIIGRVSEVTRILEAAQQGDPKAAEELLPLVYEELRQLAANMMSHELPGQTLQATALVHEAWLRLVGAEAREWQGSRHFFYAASQAMRRILCDNARRKQCLSHGGQMQRVRVEDINPASPMKPDELLALDEALERLAAEDPEAARLVELRFFTGLGHQQAAEIMGLGRRQADALWAYARTWLFEAMQEEKSEVRSPRSEGDPKSDPLGVRASGAGANPKPERAAG